MRKKDNRNTRKPYNHRPSGDYPEMHDEDFDVFDDGYQDDYYGDYDNQDYDNSGYGDDGYRDGDVYGEGNPDDFIHVNLDHDYDPDAEDIYEAPSNRIAARIWQIMTKMMMALHADINKMPDDMDRQMNSLCR